MNASPAFFLVIDLEATCDDGGRMARDETEIIEIGAVLADGETLAPLEELVTFVRPTVHRKLTPFCTKLTTITQADVDGAPLFPEAIRRLERFIGGRDVRFCSWGEYDRNQFRRDARRHGIKVPFTSGHLDLKREFSRQLGETERYGMGGALWRVGLPLVGTHHRGIDDARNITRLLPWVLGRQAVPPMPPAPPMPSGGSEEPPAARGG